MKPGEGFPVSLNVGFAEIPPELADGCKLFLAARLAGTRRDWTGKPIIYELRDDKSVATEIQLP